MVVGISTMGHNVLPLAVSGGFGTQNYQTKIKVKWNTKILMHHRPRHCSKRLLAAVLCVLTEPKTDAKNSVLLVQKTRSVMQDIVARQQ